MRTAFLDWFHQCFVPEVRKYFTSRGLPFKVLLLFDNVSDHPEPHEFNTEGVKVVCLAPDTMSLIQPLDEGIIRTLKARYTQYFMDRIVNTMEKNSDRETIMKVWKDYTIEDAIIVIEKAVKAVKPETVDF